MRYNTFLIEGSVVVQGEEGLEASSAGDACRAWGESIGCTDIEAPTSGSVFRGPGASAWATSKDGRRVVIVAKPTN